MTPKARNFNQLKTPKGSQDVLPSLARRQEEQRRKLTGLFAHRGYNQIITPTLEKLESIIEAYGEERQNELFKLVDNSGQVLVLRPDVTIPIARVVASRYPDNTEPLRVGYFTNIFSWDNHSHSHKEIYQAGVELIGEAGILADLEVIAIMCDSITELGVGDRSKYQKTLVINDTNITDKLLAGCDTEVKTAFCHNDYAYLKANAPDMYELAKLIGEPEKIFKQLDKNLKKAETEHLKKVYELLSKHYPDIDIVVDITMRPDGNYYSGIMFDLMLDNTVVAQGGRYDKLLHAYGAERPAIGFALYMDKFNRVVEPKKAAKHDDKLVTIYYTPDSVPVAFEQMRSSWENGHPVKQVLLKKLEDIDNYINDAGLFILCSSNSVLLIRENISDEELL